MLRSILLAGAIPIVWSAAAQQPASPDWQELALKQHQNATVQQMIDSTMITTLQAQIVQLKADLERAKADPPPSGEVKEQAK
jgi:outer membrane murein-binding lipoprotein Lpp